MRRDAMGTRSERRVTPRAASILASMALAAGMLAGLAPSAAAATEVTVQMSFTEQEFDPNCSLVVGFCGIGVVLPYGRATETIQFEAGCGGACDLRTISLPEGTLTLEETVPDFSCVGPCDPPGRGHPIKATLSDTVIEGTGIFEGATGHLDGTVTAAGNASLIKLAGSITLAT
jgi:hypothetical protein